MSGRHDKMGEKLVRLLVVFDRRSSGRKWAKRKENRGDGRHFPALVTAGQPLSFNWNCPRQENGN